MFKVLHAKPSRSRSRRFGGLGAALAFGALVWSAAALAGEAGASFQVTINVLPERPGSCTASTASGGPEVTCRPSVVGVSSQGDNAGRDPTVLRYRSESGLRLAGEMIEIGNENYYAWAEGERVAWGETSSRLVFAGGREYVETTVSW